MDNTLYTISHAIGELDISLFNHVQGGHAGWGGQQNNNAEGPGDSYMLQVRGTNQLNTKAVQVSSELVGIIVYT